MNGDALALNEGKATMYRLRTTSHVITSFKNVVADFIHNFVVKFSVPPITSLYLFVLLAASILVYTFYPLYREFQPADDYAIYTYFAEAVSKGINPYSIPPDYRSEIVPTFFDVGWTQPTLGVVRPQYADYPPLLMMVNSFIFQLDNLRGLYLFYLSLYGLSVALYLMYAIGNKSEGPSSEVSPLCFLIFFALNPLFSWAWFKPIGDKVWFAFFMMLILMFRNRPYWLTVTLGFFAALKGLGIPILFFYVLYMLFHKSLKLKQFLYIVMIFGLILAASHLFWFPEWIQAYQWRSARQSFVGHSSFFVPLVKLGIYWRNMPQILTILGFLLLSFLTARHILTLPETLLLPIVFSIIFNTELGFDRLLVAILAMLLLVRHNGIIVISYAVGLVLARTNLESMYSWLLMWSWTLFLLFVIGRQLLLRNAVQDAQQT